MDPALRIPAIVLGALLATGSSAAPEKEEIHACRDAAGNTVYQNDPCPEARPSRKARPPKAAAEPPARPAATKKPPVHPARPPRTAGASFPTRPVGGTETSFASPEATWRTFLSALGSGDRAAAAACLAPPALTRFGPGAASFPLEELRDTVNTFTRIEVEGDLGPFWSIRGVRPKQRPKWIFFTRTDRGEWKIAAI